MQNLAFYFSMTQSGSLFCNVVIASSLCFMLGVFTRLSFVNFFSSESGDISDILPQFPMSSSSRVSFTGRSLLTSVTYIQLFTFSCLRCCSPTEIERRKCLGLLDFLAIGNTVRLM